MNDALWTLAAILLVAAIHVVRILTRPLHGRVRATALLSEMTAGDDSGVGRIGAAHMSSPNPVDSEPQSTRAALLLIDPSGRCVYHDPQADDGIAPATDSKHLGDLLAGGENESQRILQTLNHDGKLEPYSTRVAGAKDVVLSGISLRDRDDHVWGAALFLEPLSDGKQSSGFRATKSH